jgi:hydrogenase-4 membrane subunit HyfE
MSPLAIALMGALLIPLFATSRRSSILGLAAQGLLMAAIAWRGESTPDTLQSWIAFVDLALIRGVFVPFGLYTAQKGQSTSPRDEVISPNLFSWALVLGMVLGAFNLAERLIAESGEAQTLVALAISGVLFALFVLASAKEPFGQLIGALRLENSIALLELGGAHHPAVLFQLVLLVLFGATFLVFRWYLGVLPASGEAAADNAPDLLSL